MPTSDNVEELLKRRGEITTQMERLRGALQIELDPDPEEQAIQVEHGEVAVSMEGRLREELALIEDKLIDLDKSK
ncbi:MAG: hypothetical protein WBD22_04860 [Pyrinomonadaceae bacterium]